MGTRGQKVYVFLGHSIGTIYNLHKPTNNLQERIKLMKLLTGLFGYVLLMLGVIVAIHYELELGIVIAAGGVVMFWLMLPMYNNDENERLRRYERQHQHWLKK